MSDTLTAAPAPAQTEARPPALLLGLVSALAVLLVVVAAAAVVSKVGTDRKVQSFDRSRSEALTAARQAIINLDAISAATLDVDLKRVEEASTGKFKELFTKSEATLRDLYPKQKTSSSGVIRAAAVVSSNRDTATLLIASDRTVKSVETDLKPVIQTSRWEVVMEKHGGRWLMADLEPVP